MSQPLTQKDLQKNFYGFMPPVTCFQIILKTNPKDFPDKFVDFKRIQFYLL